MEHLPEDVIQRSLACFVSRSDAGAIAASVASTVPFALGGPTPGPSATYAPVHIRAIDLIDRAGNSGDAASPIGFGYFLNDLSIANDHTGFVLASAGGSDSSPTCSNTVSSTN